MANTNIADSPGAQADWELAGEAWAHAAIDWVYRFEPYARDSVERVFEMLGVSDGRDLLYMACGSGYALGRSKRLGLAAIGSPGVCEGMVEASGFDVVERAATRTVIEAESEIDPWRILRSLGVVQPTLDHVGEDELRRQVLEAAQPFRADDGSSQLVNELTNLIARKPATSEAVR
jgi:hypothetical protein